MNKIFLIPIILFSLSNLNAQNKVDSTLVFKTNNINLSLGGGASLISLNYEKLITLTPKVFIAGELGVGYYGDISCFFGGCNIIDNYLVFPHHITANFGKQRNYFEIGVGGVPIIGDANENYISYITSGWRIQPTKSNKFNFRIFISFPVKGIESLSIGWAPIGLSFGKIF